MTYLITYRGKDGRLDKVQIEAADRDAVFAELEKRGISAIRVEETRGRLKKSGYSKKLAGKNGSFGLFKSIIAAAIVVVAGVVALFIFKPEEQTDNKPKGKKSGKIVEVAHSVPTPIKPVEVATEKEKRPEKQFWNGHEIDPKKTRCVTNGVNVVTTYIGLDGKIYKHIGKVNDKPIFDNPVDQVLAMILTTPPGSTIPPLPPLGVNSGDIFAEALKHPIEIKDDDTDEVKRVKRIVQAAREDMYNELCAGRTVNQVIEDHCTYVNENAKLRAEAVAEYRRILDEEGDEELAEQYREKANGLLTNAGAATIKKRGESRRGMQSEE